MIALLIAATAPATAVEAERAFASMAQREGQWTAFRAYAAPEAVMFLPQASNAQEFLKPLENPPLSVQWWPAASWVSCDGTLAVNTGPWLRTIQGTSGYFTTVWAKQPDGGWKWLLDHGDELKTPRPVGEAPRLRTASCEGEPAPAPVETGQSGGASADGTLVWRWAVADDLSRRVTAMLWAGATYETVLDDRVAAPPPPKP